MGSACLFCRNNSKTAKISLAPLCFLAYALIGLCQLPVTNSAAESARAHGVQSCSGGAMPQRGVACGSSCRCGAATAEGAENVDNETQ